MVYIIDVYFFSLQQNPEHLLGWHDLLERISRVGMTKKNACRAIHRLIESEGVSLPLKFDAVQITVKRLKPLGTYQLGGLSSQCAHGLSTCWKTIRCICLGAMTYTVRLGKLCYMTFGVDIGLSTHCIPSTQLMWSIGMLCPMHSMGMKDEGLVMFHSWY